MDNNYSDLELEPCSSEQSFPTTVYEDYTTTHNYTLDTLDPQPPGMARLKKNRGRKSKNSQTEISILYSFFRGQKCPKKEYIRCKIIRGQKRAIRHALNGKIPTTTIHKVNKENEGELNYWNDFANHTIDNDEFFLEMSKTVNGPKTDGAARRKGEPVSPGIQKSFNDVFCAQYFNNDLVIENYKLYLDVIFSLMEPENLIKRFDFSCCKSEDRNHFPDCHRKWNDLKDYLKEGILKDLTENSTNDLETESIEIQDLDPLLLE
ncbi:hypothetical protein SteCoe_13608 [Stentor coeruleus]|uniref:Uncharacterized protein n=1 Tax=Stentor coeruleus TaxID=5963 RepID=A0A1R2C801_9CILI|nr:hypothetical protein SteCoe_13608 [Stentor coeruleus]